MGAIHKVVWRRDLRVSSLVIALFIFGSIDLPNVIGADDRNGSQGRFAVELRRLATDLLKRRIDISEKCQAAEKEERINEGVDDGTAVIMGAAYASHLNARIFQSRYPEIWRRAAIVDIREFDGSGTKTVLFRYFASATVPLALTMYKPLALKHSIQYRLVAYIRVEDEKMGDRFRADAPLRLWTRKNRTLIEALDETHPMGSGEDRTFTISHILVEYRHKRFRVVARRSEELPESKWIPPEKFYKDFD